MPATLPHIQGIMHQLLKLDKVPEDLFGTIPAADHPAIMRPSIGVCEYFQREEDRLRVFQLQDVGPFIRE